MHASGLQHNPRRCRPLRCSTRPERDGLGGGGAGAAQAPPLERLCRICWDCESEEDALVAPCACSGSMRHVHARCLAYWQAQLRAQKGLAASRRCDVCKAPWAKAHQPPSTPASWRDLLRDLLRRVPWPAVLECWKFSVLAVGAIRGMQAGMAGFRSGMEWAAGASRHNVEGLARWAPEMALAAGALPPLKVPMAVCLAAFVTGLAAQVALLSLVCAYAGSMLGFASGVAGSLLATLQLGAGILHQGALAASVLASCAAQGAAAVGKVVTPMLMSLLKSLALTRLFA